MIIHKRIRMAVIVLLVLSFTAVLWTKPSLSFSDQILVVGVKGNDVYELQGRLKFLGYYGGSIDGQFGWKTYWSVRNFQYQFGIPIDGVVGSQTKNKLYRATRNWRSGETGRGTSPPAAIPSTNKFSGNDMTLLARAVYSEARGEPYEGQVAVAAVILNRMRSPLFPNSISGVIFEPRAFTAVDDGQFWGMTPVDASYKAVKDAINGWDPSLNALYYFNPVTATSAWIWSRPQIKKIGKHIFCE